MGPVEAERDVLGDVLSCIVAILYSLLMAGVLAIVLNSCGSVPKWGEVARGHVVCGEARLRYIVSSWGGRLSLKQMWRGLDRG